MALKFYFDTHIARAVATHLRAQGVDITRCEEVGMAEASDNAHLSYASQHEYIMVSQDDDFVVLHVQWLREGHEHWGIIKVPGTIQGQGMISTLVRELAFYHEAEATGAVTAQEFKNTLIYL